MSSRNKRSAESVEVSGKKKPRKDNDDDVFDEDDSASSFNDDDLEELDPKNVITTGRRTRGIRVDYTKVANTEGLVDDESQSETETKGPKKRKEAVKNLVKNPRTKSPERKQATNVEEVDEGGEGEEDGEDEGEEEGQDDLLGDEDGDDGDDDDDDDD